MSRKLCRPGLVVALILAGGRLVMAQGFQNLNEESFQNQQIVKPTGPAAKKADDLIQGYTARIEQEIDQGRKEVEETRTEVDTLVYKLLELRAGIPASYGGFGGMGGMMGGGMAGSWFGSIVVQSGGMR
jgi:hypothetical protein